MSGMIKVKNPAEPTFVPNKLVQSFNPDEYYATHSHFDAVCGTSEVKLFCSQALKNISIFIGKRLPWEEGSILPKYELPLREGRQPSVLKMHGSHRLQGFPPCENIFTCSIEELRDAWFSSRLYNFRRSKSKHSDELWDESRGAQQPTGRLHAPDDPPPRECRQHGKVGRTTVRLLRD